MICVCGRCMYSANLITKLPLSSHFSFSTLAHIIGPCSNLSSSDQLKAYYRWKLIGIIILSLSAILTRCCSLFHRPRHFFIISNISLVLSTSELPVIYFCYCKLFSLIYWPQSVIYFGHLMSHLCCNSAVASRRR